MDIHLSLPEVGDWLGLSSKESKRVGADPDQPKVNGKACFPPSQVRTLAEAKGFRYPKKNIVFHCLKGGASKTTLAYNSAFRLSQLGARVLLVDLDKQGNATHSVGVKRPELVFVDIVTEKCRVGETIAQAGEYLDVLPSSLENARLEMELVNRKRNPQTFFRNLFSPIRDRYDFLIFDLPPDLSHCTYLSTLFADIVCIPTTPDEYSVYGTRMTLASLESLRKEYENLTQEVWIVWSRFDAREKQSLHYIGDFKEVDSARVLPSVIRSDVTFKNAQGQKKSVFQLTKKSNAREDVDLLVQEMIGMKEFFGVKGNA